MTLLLAFVVFGTSRASDSLPVPDTNENTPQQADNSPGGPDVSVSGPSRINAQANGGDVTAEIILRSGAVTKGDPAKASLSETSLICFPDCKDAPRDSPDTDLIMLKDGQRKSGRVSKFLEYSYDKLLKVWQGKAARLSGDSEEDFPFSAIRYIKFSDHVFDSLTQALRKPKEAHRLSLNGGENKHLSPRLGSLTNLKVLNIACMEQLEDLPVGIGNLLELEELVIDNGNGCQMNITLPASIGRLQRLKILRLYGALDLSGPDPGSPGPPTRKKPLPLTLGGLRNLEVLDLGRNGSGMGIVPVQIASLRKLKILNLDFDDIRVIPSFIGNLKELKYLSLVGEHHRLTLPDSFSALEGLKVDMGNNYLTLKDQDRLRKRFPKIVFSFDDEYDDVSANESAPKPPEQLDESLFDGGGSMTANGWRIEWRHPGTSFTLELRGKVIHSIDDPPQGTDVGIKLMTHMVDGVIVQIRSAAINQFAPKAAEQKLSNQSILAAHRDWEIEASERALGEKLTVKSAEQQSSIGKVLLWKYEKPKQRGFEQMFVTAVLGGNVVILNAPVEDKTAESTVEKRLLDAMSTLRIFDR